MRAIHNFVWMLAGVACMAPPCLATNASVSTPHILDLAQREVSAYLAQLADLHCTEVVTQEKLAPNGHVEDTEHATYDYLLMMSGTADDLRLNESRVEQPSNHHKAISIPMLVSNGMSTMLLVFHPYYRDSFQFDVGAAEMVNGKETIPVHFAHLAGRRTPAALALRGREYPLELQGTAWLDEQSGEVVKMDASLLHDMSDVGLSSLHIEVDYRSSRPNPEAPAIALPELATVDVTTPRQHWRNMHRFESYKSFSTAIEQGPDVKIHAESQVPDDSKGTESSAAPRKEKP
ncbi:MAG: hypothetical protein WCA37_07580 [Terracidiphilus sp.]